jgi:hypothetical protein
MLAATALIDATRPTVIRPSITAYSTAVGPSSLTINREINLRTRDMVKFSELSNDRGVELVRAHTQTLCQNDGQGEQT